MPDSFLETFMNNPTQAKIGLGLLSLVSLYITFKLFKKMLKMVVLFLVLTVLILTGILLAGKENPVEMVSRYIDGGKETISRIEETKTEFSKGMEFLKEFNKNNNTLPDGQPKKTLTQERVQELLEKYEK